MGGYARVSTTDRQDIQTQIVALPDFCRVQGFEVVAECVEHTPESDIRGKTAWRRMPDDGAKHSRAACMLFRRRSRLQVSSAARTTSVMISIMRFALSCI